MAEKLLGAKIKGVEYNLCPQWENIENKPDITGLSQKINNLDNQTNEL